MQKNYFQDTSEICNGSSPSQGAFDNATDFPNLPTAATIVVGLCSSKSGSGRAPKSWTSRILFYFYDEFCTKMAHYGRIVIQSLSIMDRLSRTNFQNRILLQLGLYWISLLYSKMFLYQLVTFVLKTLIFYRF